MKDTANYLIHNITIFFDKQDYLKQSSPVYFYCVSRYNPLDNVYKRKEDYY